MATIKNKPRGYFKFALALDCETTGLNFGSTDPSEGHQALSWGLVVVDVDTMTEVEEMYVEIKWNEETKESRKKDPTFGKKAEEIHGLTFDHLEQHGIPEEQAVLQIGQLILKYWGPDVCVHLIGHNVHLFDLAFFRSMFSRYGINIKFGNRHFDSNSVGFATTGAYNSDDLFAAMGLESRTTHNALDDAKMAFEVFKRTRVLWDKLVGVTVNE